MKILYLYLRAPDDKIQKTFNRTLPSDQLFGLLELRKLGYDVDYADSQPRGRFRKLINYLNTRFGLCIKDFHTLKTLSQYDVILVKGPFSTTTSIFCRTVRKKLLYIDPIQRIPRNPLRRLIIAFNLRAADGSVVFSNNQRDLILGEFKVPESRLKHIHFSIDTAFFTRPASCPPQYKRRFILAVGIDMGRDYATLISALEGVDIDLKIVALPYLLAGLPIDKRNIEVLTRIPYSKLFDLYTEAMLVIVPLKRCATTYPSGITNLLEAKLFEKPVIATRSKPLQEYLADDEGVFYVDPEDAESMRNAITRFINDDTIRNQYSSAGSARVRDEFNMPAFVNKLVSHLQTI